MTKSISIGTKDKTFFEYCGNIYNLHKKDVEIMFSQEGIKTLQHLIGEYALIWYDAEHKMFYAALDRLGVKTLYYHISPMGVEVSTSLLALCRGKNYHVDEYARQCYFSMQYIPAPNTMVQEVKKLLPGEILEYSTETGHYRLCSYWDFYDNTSLFTRPSSYDEAMRTSESLIMDTVNLRIQNQYSVGTFLSGGIDSSLITMMACRLKSNVDCFSIGFDENSFDESQYACEVANRLGAKMHHFICTPNDALRIIDGLQQWYDEPMGDASMIPTSFLCEQAKECVDFALGGDGGDEVFFGYPRYLRYARYKSIYSLHPSVRGLMANVAEICGKQRISKTLRLPDVQTLYMNRRPSNRAELFDATKIQQSLSQCHYLYDQTDVRRGFNDFDIKTLMCYAYNVKVDRAALRANLNVSAPLLDYRIVEYSRLLPLTYCYTKEYGQKRILRDLLYQQLPRELFEREKRGFGVPIGIWFRGPLKDYLIDILNEQTVSLLPDFDSAKLLQIRDRHIDGVEDQTTLLWLCVNYIAWYQLFEEIIHQSPITNQQ